MADGSDGLRDKEVSEEVLNKARETLVELANSWAGGVSKGQTWSLDGQSHGGEHTYCHSWVGSAYSLQCGSNWTTEYKATAKNFLTLSCHSKRRSKGICSEEAHSEIALWVASDENPLSKFILNRDDKETICNGGVVILCGPDGASQSECMWICKVLRYAVEHGQALDVWLELKKSGVAPLLALYVCTFVRSMQGATFAYSGKYDHVAVFGRMEDKEVAKLLKPTPDPTAPATTYVFADLPKKRGYYGYGENDARFQQFCKPVKKSDGWGGMVEGKGADRKDFINRILEWQKELEGGEPVVVKAKKPTRKTVYLEMDM